MVLRRCLNFGQIWGLWRLVVVVLIKKEYTHFKIHGFQKQQIRFLIVCLFICFYGVDTSSNELDIRKLGCIFSFFLKNGKVSISGNNTWTSWSFPIFYLIVFLASSTKWTLCFCLFVCLFVGWFGMIIRNRIISPRNFQTSKMFTEGGGVK